MEMTLESCIALYEKYGITFEINDGNVIRMIRVEDIF